LPVRAVSRRFATAARLHAICPNAVFPENEDRMIITATYGIMHIIQTCVKIDSREVASIRSAGRKSTFRWYPHIT
jgi:hypothetical protein